MAETPNQKFLSHIADEVELTPKERKVLLARFDRKNHDTQNIDLANKIFSQINKPSNSFQSHLGKAIRKVNNHYDLGLTLSPKPGRKKEGKANWKKVNDWLWHSKFPDWEQSQAAALESQFTTNWPYICKEMLKVQRRATSYFWLHSHETAQKALNQIYVPLALVEKRKPDKRGDDVSSSQGSKLYAPDYEEKERFEYEGFLNRILKLEEGRSQGRRIALIGEPGAGKTTVLQSIAFWLIEQELGLPIWVPLAQVSKHPGEIDLQEYLYESWLKTALGQGGVSEDSKKELAEQIEQGRVWLLLDGLDEVAKAGVDAISAVASNFQGWFGKVRIIVTCRLNVWQSAHNALADCETYRLSRSKRPRITPMRKVVSG